MIDAAIHCPSDLKIILPQAVENRDWLGELMTPSGKCSRLWFYWARGVWPSGAQCSSEGWWELPQSALRLQGLPPNARESGNTEEPTVTQHAWECHLPPPTAVLQPHCWAPAAPASSFLRLLPPHPYHGSGKMPQPPHWLNPQDRMATAGTAGTAGHEKSRPSPSLHQEENQGGAPSGLPCAVQDGPWQLPAQQKAKSSAMVPVNLSYYLIMRK